MLSSPYFTRLAAATAAALLLAGAMMNARVLTAAPKIKPMAASVYASKECAIGEPVLAAGFAPVEQVLSVAPIGPPRLKGEADPAPLLRVIARNGAPMTAQAPARGEIVAIAKSTELVDGRPVVFWSLSMIPCADHLVAYDGLAALDARIMKKLGPAAKTAASFVKEVRIKVGPGDIVGTGDSFEIGLYAADRLTQPKRDAAPDRYLSPSLTAARCPIEHLKRSEAPQWKALFGDTDGAKLPAVESACATSRMAPPKGAQGLWLTDSSHGARTNKVASAALTGDIARPDRLVLSFFGRLNSLQASMFDAEEAHARAEAARTYLTAAAGLERINAPFADIVPNAPYCYQNLRAGLDGPRFNGVLVLELTANAAGAPLLKVEAIPDVKNCENLREPWSFTGAETAFFRPSAAP